MAHMIDSLAYTGETPWHGLGRRLPSFATVDSIIEAGGLDWAVHAAPLFAGLNPETGAGVSVAGYKALVRSDRPEVTLSVVTESYGVVQNDEAAALAAAAVGPDKACAEVCGALDDGRRAFVVLSVPEAGFDIRGEAVAPYMLACWSHDTSLPVKFRFTPTRVVCANTLAAALGQSVTHEVSIRHTRNAAERVKLAENAIREARAYFGAFHTTALALVEKTLSQAGAERIAAELFPAYHPATEPAGRMLVPINQTKLVELFRHQRFQRTDRTIAGTAWGFYNATAALLDHNTRRTGGAEGRMLRAVAGTQDAIRTQALELLLAA